MSRFIKSSKYKLVNFVKVLDSDLKHEIVIEDGILKLSFENTLQPEAQTIDCKDCIIAPGFVDLQVNGLGNCNFWDLDNLSIDKVNELRVNLAKHGVVAFLPTIITASQEKILKTIDFINNYLKKFHNTPGAKILGIHIEGIFITNYGVHNKEYVINNLTIETVSPYVRENVVLFTLAPELDKTGEAIRFLQKNNILVSIGHSNGSYQDGLRAIHELGIKTVTHVFNTLKGIEGFHHRDFTQEGYKKLIQKISDEKKIDKEKDGILIPILKEKDVLCMVIADGVHVNKEVIKFLKDQKNSNSFALASDHISKDITLESKSSLAGGKSTLDVCVQNLVNWGICSVEDGLLSASFPVAEKLYVAKNIGLGKIHIQKEANIVIWDKKMSRVKGTIIGENIFLND